MPDRNTIDLEIKNSADITRKKYLTALQAHTQRDTVIYATAFSSKNAALSMLPSFLLSITNEDIQGFMSAFHQLKGNALDLILHSPGGSLEAAEQIVNYIRKKYNHVRAIIPQNAMSAATMIACACDEIVMAKHSAIGPVDPQIPVTSSGNNRYFIPAQSILDEFEEAKKEITQNPALATLWVHRINQYPHGFMEQCRHIVQLSKDMVAKWLSKYMFSSDQNAKEKAMDIAEWLSDTKQHKTHGRPLDIDILKQKGLKVSSLEDDHDFQEKVLSVFHATMITFELTPCVKLIENHLGKGIYILVQPNR